MTATELDYLRELPEDMSPFVAQVILNLAVIDDGDRLAPRTREIMLQTAARTNAEFDQWVVDHVVTEPVQ